MVAEFGHKRRRSSIIPEILNGEPNGVGDLRIGARFMPKGKEHQLMDWDYLQKVVVADDLDKLIRHPDCEKEYIDWAKGIKAHYGGLENYIVKERLGWDKGDLPLVESNASPTQFFNDIIMNDLSNIKVVFNDWPYGIR
ncbi:hypothetical protein L7F22_043746 [Adiantum nelumboides]|nr:hypothetical protein [Adiantum nelumboides]